MTDYSEFPFYILTNEAKLPSDVHLLIVIKQAEQFR